MLHYFGTMGDEEEGRNVSKERKKEMKKKIVKNTRETEAETTV